MDDHLYFPPPAEPDSLRAPWPAGGRWFRAPYRLLIIHTALILVFMLALYRGWTDFTPQPYDCFYPPYLLISGPFVYGVAHYAQHRAEPFISIEDTETIRWPWNLVPGSVCLILGGIQWWLIELAYINPLLRRWLCEDRFATVASYHDAALPTLYAARNAKPDDGKIARKIEWHILMRDKYLGATCRPWLPVEADTPQPE